MIEITILMASLAGLFIAATIAVVAASLLLATAVHQWRHRDARHDQVRLDRAERRAFKAITTHHASPAGWVNGDNPDKALPDVDCSG